VDEGADAAGADRDQTVDQPSDLATEFANSGIDSCRCLAIVSSPYLFSTAAAPGTGISSSGGDRLSQAADQSSFADVDVQWSKAGSIPADSC
jgi:hypothetical protein